MDGCVVALAPVDPVGVSLRINPCATFCDRQQRRINNGIHVQIEVGGVAYDLRFHIELCRFLEL